MSTQTTNYNFTKPDYSDSADISDLNGNFDIADDVIKEVSDKVDNNTSSISGLQTTVQGKQDASDNTLTTTDKTIPGAINELVDKAFATWKHDNGSNAIRMSGLLSSVGTWIKENYIPNKWIACRVNPTDNTGYFGSSSFSVLANCSSTNYGVAQLLCDNPNKSAIVVGQLVDGAWSWRAVSTEPDIVVEEKSASFSATSGNGSIVISIGKSGYTPIGVVGITGSNTSVLTYSDFYIESSTTAKVYYHCSGSYNITLKVRILYKRNTSTT